MLLGPSCVTGHSSVGPFGAFMLLFFHFSHFCDASHLQNVATATTACDPSLSTHSEDHPLMSLTDYPLRSPIDPSPPRRTTHSGRQQTHLCSDGPPTQVVNRPISASTDHPLRSSTNLSPPWTTRALRPLMDCPLRSSADPRIERVLWLFSNAYPSSEPQRSLPLHRVTDTGLLSLPMCGMLTTLTFCSNSPCTTAPVCPSLSVWARFQTSDALLF